MVRYSPEGMTGAESEKGSEGLNEGEGPKKVEGPIGAERLVIHIPDQIKPYRHVDPPLACASIEEVISSIQSRPFRWTEEDVADAVRQRSVSGAFGKMFELHVRNAVLESPGYAMVEPPGGVFAPEQGGKHLKWHWVSREVDGQVLAYKLSRKGGLPIVEMGRINQTCMKRKRYQILAVTEFDVLAESARSYIVGEVKFSVTHTPEKVDLFWANSLRTLEAASTFLPRVLDEGKPIHFLLVLPECFLEGTYAAQMANSCLDDRLKSYQRRLHELKCRIVPIKVGVQEFQGFAAEALKVCPSLKQGLDGSLTKYF